MTKSDRLLRATVADAHALRGKPAYRDALDRILFVHRTWPLIEFAQAMIVAEEELEARVCAVEAAPWRHWEFMPQIDIRALAAARSVVSAVAA